MKKNKKDILIVGAYPPESKNTHPGGQITITKDLILYLKKNNLTYDVIDTTQNTFPSPTIYTKLKDAFHRIKLIIKYTKKNTYKGSLVFSSDGLGFLEKIILAHIIQLRKVPTMFFMVSGYFIDQVNSSIIFRTVSKFLLKKITFIAHQGGVWHEFYSKLNIDKSKLYPILNWTDTSQSIKNKNIDSDNESLVFLYVGWLTEKKGVLDLLEVIEENSILKKFTFIFAGSGTLYDYMKQVVSDKNLNNIILKGWLSHDEVIVEYKKADVFIFPSHSEGFPGVIIEALKYKLPIISTNVGGISESVINDYNGYLISHSKKEQLLNAIIEMSKNKEKRMIFSENSQTLLLKNHDIKKNCNILLSAFNIKVKE